MEPDYFNRTERQAKGRHKICALVLCAMDRLLEMVWVKLLTPHHGMLMSASAESWFDKGYFVIVPQFSFLSLTGVSDRLTETEAAKLSELQLGSVQTRNSRPKKRGRHLRELCIISSR